MNSEIALVRYGLLMAGQPLEGPLLKDGWSLPGHFLGSLFEGRQRLPLENGARHYPVAVLTPPKAKIRCEISFQKVSDVMDFWDDLLEKEMCYPHLPVDQSLMNLTHTSVFRSDGNALLAPVFVLNPLFYLFHKNRYGMHLTEIEPDKEGFVSWLDVPFWAPDDSYSHEPGHSHQNQPLPVDACP